MRGREKFLLLVVGALTVVAVGGGLHWAQAPGSEAGTPGGRAPLSYDVEQAAVIKVTDGDTFHVKLSNGEERTIRVIGIDTPETKDPGKPVQCYGPEASAEATELLTGEQVLLTRDPSQGDRDYYGRYLREVYLTTGGRDYGQVMIEYGFAREYLFKKPYAQRAKYLQAQQTAQQKGAGLWTDCQG